MNFRILVFLSVVLFSCGDSVETTKPTIESISQSVYASGVLKSQGQYQAFASVSGIVNQIFVLEGDTVKKGDPILTVSNEVQKLNTESARIVSDYNALSANQGKLNEAASLIEFSGNKMRNDSALFYRQKNLWEQEIGTKVELEQRELAWQNSKNSYNSAIIRYNDLKRQLNFAATQARKNLSISQTLANDYTLKSEIDGIVYNIYKLKGEIVSPQSSVAVIGSADKFILEMQVDENDILLIKNGQKVLVNLDSYKGKVFEAVVTRINPLMNERNKTFLVEAEFIQKPERVYPNITFEANIIIQEKSGALLIPRTYLLKDSLVIKSSGDTVPVKTGLKDYQKVEILSGIKQDDELVKPVL
ncbi:MAG: efflux RND transporter periplasmic adaptor subunit [Daejeonella sp.]|uniref:efflux RND transporter periplasmic adaptor subunit n=1 Tax=Daejeonella sp. TaxID=2805397 RepID=UPI002736EBAF|nr:efflux RND transporter periplasmic adaptor subunit [Daejeonella sp.]MDP3469340.1 efflux RND transporter periplasmic adaptor subunit [Daejeonella sp.]